MWSVDSQDWRITAGGQTEAGLIANVTQWANTANTLTRGGNSLMHDLNNVTVGANLKALPILHPKVQLSPVGVCAGWNNASYQEQVAQQPASSASGAVPAVTPAAGSAVPSAAPSASANAIKNNAGTSGASSLVKNPVTIAVAAALAAFVGAF